MKLSSKIVYFLLFIITAPALGQQLETIRTESDWEYLYRDGYYDYNTFQILRELAEGQGIDDTAEYIASSLAVSPADQSGLLSRLEGQNPGFSSSDASVYFPDRIKIGRKNYNGDNGGYVSLYKKSKYLSTEIKMRDEEGENRVENRSFNFRTEDLGVSIGNYTVIAGCGLGLGRFDYRPISFEPSLKRGEDILFPDNSLYNGLKVEYRGISLLFSVKKYNSVNKRLIGGILSRSLGNCKIGVTGAGTMLNSGNSSKTLGTGSLFLENRNMGLAAELGYGESGTGVCMRLNSDNHIIKIWRYDDSFVNLQSSGYSHPDYEYFSDDRFELSFRQPQSGETGVLYKHKYALGGINARVSSEFWKRSPRHRVAMENGIYLISPVNKAVIIETGFSDRRGTGNDRRLADLGIAFRRVFEIGLYGNILASNEQIDKKRSNYYLFTAIPLRANIDFRARIRRDLSGRIDYYIEQRSLIDKAFSLTFTYRWSERYDSDLGPLYLTMEKLW